MNTSDTSGILPTVALIAGPTASGKSALALALADLTPSIIINADSMQVYRDLRIVTARPSEAEEARHPHRLFGTIDGAEACSAARWAGDARLAIAEGHAHGRLPILVGGTGLYLRTLLDGIAPVPPIDPDIRCTVRSLSVAQAHSALVAEDPAAAARLAPADTARVMRALEVVRSTGRSLTDWQAQRAGGIGAHVRLIATILLPPREWLAERSDARFDAMFERGQQEVADLSARNLDPGLPVMRAIGVREIAAFLNGNSDGDQARKAGQLATRQYAKRQQTWFANQSPPDWTRITQETNYDYIKELATLLRDNALTA